MRFGICNETYQGWDWEAACRHAAQTGYNGIEIAPFTLAEDIRSLETAERRRIRETAERAGLEVIGLHWLLVSPKGLSVTSSDAAVRHRTSAYLEALAEFCGDLGGRVMVFGSPAQRRVEEGDTAEAALERLAQTIRPALDRAAELGIAFCLEPLPAPEANLLLTLEEAVTLARKLDHPAARTILDVKSASADREPVAELIARYAPWIAHVHANDSNRRGPGFGSTDFRPILSALNLAGYGGYVSVEVFDYSPDPETIATQSLAHLRRALGER